MPKTKLLATGNVTSFLLSHPFQEYLFEQDTALVHYAYVQECLQRDDIPRLTPVLLKDVLECLGLPVPEEMNCDDCTPPYPSSAVNASVAAPPLPSVIDLFEMREEDEENEATEASIDLWDLRDYFSLTVRAAQKLTTVTQNSSTVCNNLLQRIRVLVTSFQSLRT